MNLNSRSNTVTHFVLCYIVNMVIAVLTGGIVAITFVSIYLRISAEYYHVVMMWYWNNDNPELSIFKEVFEEGAFLGGIQGLWLLIIHRKNQMVSREWRISVMQTLLRSIICAMVFGLSGAVWVLLSPQTYATWFDLPLEDGVSAYTRFAFVGASIWGWYVSVPVNIIWSGYNYFRKRLKTRLLQAP